MDIKELRKALRTAVADYISSEGCSCCRGDAHDKHKEILAKLLNVKKYDDGFGYNFEQYETKKTK